MNIDLSAAPGNPNFVRSESFSPGDLLRTRQGRLYLVVSIPEPTRRWMSSNTLYYFSISPEGDVLRAGQVIYGYALENWELVGHCEISISAPVWKQS